MRTSLIIGMILVQCTVAFAQYNSDRLEVQRKKIKSAASYEINKDGDTIFYRYTYDHKGRLVQTRDWKTNDYVHEQTFSTSGKLISDLDLHIEGDDRTIRYSNGVETQDYYTSWYYFQRYDERTGAEIYDSVLQYDMYNGYKPDDGWLLKSHGDTTFYYTFARDSFRINEFYIKRPVDTIRHGYSVTTYSVRTKNHNEASSQLDTFVYAHIYVLDKKGNEIRCYYFKNELRDTGFVKLSDGTLYSPVNDTLANLILYKTYVNIYRWYGTLKYWIGTNTLTGETDRYDNPKRERSEERIDSLTEIRKYGPATFEYYE